MIVAGVLVALAVAAWASGRIPEHLVSLAFFVLAVLLRVAPPGVVFSGFTSGALWLIFGGQIMGVAIRHTGLADRIAAASARTIGARSYPAVLRGVVTLGVVLSFFMPSSMGRVMLLMPIATALADRYGFRDAGPGRHGIVLAAVFGTAVPSFAILPANVPNAVLLGAAESEYGIVLRYFEYLALHFPLLGIARAVVVVVLLSWLFPARLQRPAHDGPPPAPFSRRERAVCALVGLALLLWATDAIHGIPASWVSLGVGVLLLAPGADLVPPRAFNEQLNYASLFFVAGVMGVGAVMAHTGLAAAAGRAASAVLPLRPGSPGANFASLAALGSALALATTAPGLPGVMTPLARTLAEAAGLPVKTVVMSEVLGFSNNLLPYQTPPVVVGMQLTDTPRRVAASLSLALFAVTSIVILPLDYVWWRLLGWL